MHSEELRSLYTSTDFFRVNESRRLGLLEHVARMEEMINAHRDLIGKTEGTVPLRTWK